jgi:hypothetical protein
MSLDFYLPKPTEEELNLGKKVDYFQRIIDLDLVAKYKITRDDLIDWTHHNFQAVFLLDEELSFKSYKKLR